MERSKKIEIEKLQEQINKAMNRIDEIEQEEIEKTHKMRELKFRAWDKIRKVMVSLDNPKSYGDNQQEWWGDVVVLSLEGIQELSKDAGIELMQFTGLKDKNGKEIYEGDIIDFDYPMAVIWDMGSWAVKTNKGSSLLYGYTTDGEIIGNIYSNPELLK